MVRGTLFLVVGPSGVGKDSLLDGARAALADGDYVFARRVITRPADAGGETHYEASAADFAAMREAGAFALSWRANGLDYAIPAEIETHLAHGRHVVANVSRTVIDEARARYRPLRVICVAAPAEIVARRLAARGRESAADIAARLARGGALAVPEGPDVAVVVNDASLETGITRMLTALRATAIA
ncbi:MAG: phosphonate metabolism protein/1,5-bisphosphokinase (PRPP-forming) PhnN [Alphaproteobacteria bacterium]